NFAQYGFEFGGPLIKKKIFFYVNYEGARVRSGAQIFEAIPSAGVRTRAVDSILRVLPGFNESGATIVTGASTNPNFDIVELNSTNITNKNGVAVHLNLVDGPHEASLIYLREHLFDSSPEGVTGRTQFKRDVRQTAIFRHTKLFESGVKNEFIFGVNSS